MWGNCIGNLKFMYSNFIHPQNINSESQHICVFHIDIDIYVFVNCNWVDTRRFSEKMQYLLVEHFPLRFYVFTARNELTL